MGSREFDLVLLGATGYVGGLTAKQLAQRAPEGARVALAGRDSARLTQVRAELPGAGPEWPIVQVDAHDRKGLDRLAARTTAVITTIGPYLKLGLPLVAACANAGTHYVDLTGEVLFMRASIDGYQEVAAASGARIVHGCGFDSIPSDLGVALLAAAAGELAEATLVVRRLSGGFSGGTIDSMRVQVARAAKDPAARAVLGDPYALSPDRASEADLGPQPDFGRPRQLPEVGWVAPFLMASCNTRVVRRSNALQGWRYGRSLRYQEVQAMGEGAAGLARASALTAGLGGLAVGMGFGPTRSLLSRALPKPGEGPDVARLDQGDMVIEIRGQDTAGATWTATVAQPGDPGYGSTAGWLAEAGLSAAFDGPAGLLPGAAGVLTPATAFGPALVDRLRAGGMTLTVAGPGTGAA